MKKGLLLVAFLFIAPGSSLLLCQGVEYTPGGKRDPFFNLLKTREQAPPAQIVGPPPLAQRPPGLAGLLVSEVSVGGTASASGKKIAILQGIDDTSYIAREGTKLFNGFIEKIEGSKVVFVRIQVDTRGRETVSRLTKEMQTEEQ